MKALKKVFKATVIRYNFGDPFQGESKEYNEHPTESELLDFLNECNTKHDFYKDFHTRITVEKIYIVINE